MAGANLSDILKKNSKYISDRSISTKKPSFTKEGLEDLVNTPFESKVKAEVGLNSSISEAKEPPISDRSEKIGLDSKKESSLKSESGSISESSLKTELASKKNLVREKLESAKYSIDSFELLNRDEYRFIKFLELKIQEDKTSEVQLSKNDFAKFANINIGRFHNTRKGLIEKRIISMRAAVDDKNRPVVFYRLKEQ